MPVFLTNHADDTTKDAEALAKKILTLRVFDDETGQQMWKRSVKDIDGEILCGARPLWRVVDDTSITVYSPCRNSKRGEARFP